MPAAYYASGAKGFLGKTHIFWGVNPSNSAKSLGFYETAMADSPKLCTYLVHSETQSNTNSLPFI